jgi:hypothetical protein
MNQRALAKSLVGKWVRFAHLSPAMQPRPIRVLFSVNGMVQLEDRAGFWAPDLFTVVRTPAEQMKSIRSVRNVLKNRRA